MQYLHYTAGHRICMGILQDLRFCLRTLRKNVSFTLATIFALALGIGANASIFTIVRSVLLRPLPLKNPRELVELWRTRPERDRYPFNLPTFLDLRDRNRALQDVAAYGSWNANLMGEAEPERLLGVRASANYFEMLGVQAARGRTLAPDDDIPGRPKVVVLTYGLWQRRFGSDPGIVGKPVLLNGEPYTVVGVLPRTFALGYVSAEIAVPLVPDADPWRNKRGSIHFLRLVARLKPGVTGQQAKADLDSVAAQLRREYPVENAGWTGVNVVPLDDELVGGTRLMLLVLMGAVGLVLLIACSNIASLLIAKSAARQKEIAIRSALGGGQWRLARQFLLEGVALSVTGGLVGTLIAIWGVKLLLALASTDLPRSAEVHVDPTILLLTVGVSLVCGILFGLIPAIQAIRRDVTDGLRSDGRTSTAGASRGRVRSVLVIGEVALSIVLLVGAGLLLKSFLRLQSVDPGFRPEGVLTLRLALPVTRYKTTETIMRFHDRLLSRVAAMPGVASVGSTEILPLSGLGANAGFTIAGRPPVLEKDKPVTHYRAIDPGYFRTMGIPILRGRDISEADKANTRSVAVVSATLVKRYWPNQNPVGQHVELGDTSGPPRDLEVVGVSGEIRATELDQGPTPCLFIALAQAPQDAARFIANNLFWVVRTSTEPMSLAKTVRREIHAVDGDVAAASTLTMEQYMQRSVSARRFSLEILGIFAAAALLLAATGLYALLSYTAMQRTREIGVRMALGANSADVVRLILGQGLSLALLGIVIGGAGALALSSIITAMLFDVAPHDPVTLAGVSLMLLAVAAGASYLPARRALRIDPVNALRSE